MINVFSNFCSVVDLHLELLALVERQENFLISAFFLIQQSVVVLGHEWHFLVALLINRVENVVLKNVLVIEDVNAMVALRDLISGCWIF